MKKEILGILGGMGPYAALKFNEKILDYDNAIKDWEYIHIILDNNITIPSRTRAILYKETDPTPYIIKAINKLSLLGVKTVVLPCNSVHYFYEKVTPYIESYWINMLEVVSNEVKSKKLKKTLILGGYVTVNKKLYDKYLSNTIYLDDEGNSIVYNLIETAKLNDQDKMEEFAQKLIRYFDIYIKDYQIDSILFACTELALSKSLQEYTSVEIFDTNDIYAQYAVKFMKSK